MGLLRDSVPRNDKGGVIASLFYVIASRRRGNLLKSQKAKIKMQNEEGFCIFNCNFAFYVWFLILFGICLGFNLEIASSSLTSFGIPRNDEGGGVMRVVAGVSRDVQRSNLVFG